jgi:hypothetical protein
LAPKFAVVRALDAPACRLNDRIELAPIDAIARHQRLNQGSASS